MSPFWQGILVTVVTLTSVITVGVMMFLLKQNIAFKRLGKSARLTPDDKDSPEFTKAAMAVDPEHLPSWRVYQPKPGAPVRFCTCHPDRILQAGQKVLWWPVPHSGGAVNVFCSEGIEVDE